MQARNRRACQGYEIDKNVRARLALAENALQANDVIGIKLDAPSFPFSHLGDRAGEHTVGKENNTDSCKAGRLDLDPPCQGAGIGVGGFEAVRQSVNTRTRKPQGPFKCTRRGGRWN
jgi:hypothetical protein